MKTCESSTTQEEHRVKIGRNHRSIPQWRRGIGMALIYLPIFTWPFVLASALFSYYHLKMVGAENLKTLFDFLPKRETHRFNLKNQITMKPTFLLSLAQHKLYWFFNCTWYCPVSVGLFEWHVYLVKLIENWWCPFSHNRKQGYESAKIDQSFWHIYPEDIQKLHKDDLENPIWNDQCEQCPSTEEDKK